MDNKNTESNDQNSYQDSQSDSFPDPLTFSQSLQSASPPSNDAISPTPTPLAVAPSADVHTFTPNPWETPPVSAAAASDVPVAPTSFAAPPVQFGPPKKSRKKLVTGAIIAGTLVILGGAGALAYNFWYQNPEKVVTDSIINAFNAKTVAYTGKLTVTGDTKVEVVVSGSGKSDASNFDVTATFSVDGEKFTLKGSALFDSKRDLYVKLSNIDEIVGLASGFIPAETQKLVDKLVAEINNKWIRIEASEIEKWSADTSKSQKCLDEAQKKLETDSRVRAEIIELYRDNQFITIDKTLPAKDGSLGYLLKGDSSAAKSFASGLKDTSIYKSLHACDDTFTFTLTEDDIKSLSDVNGDDSGGTGTAELWVSRWSHEITKFHVQSTESSSTAVTLDVLPIFNKPVTITTPTESVSLSKLQKDIEAIVNSYTLADDESTMKLFDDAIVTPTT